MLTDGAFSFWLAWQFTTNDWRTTQSGLPKPLLEVLDATRDKLADPEQVEVHAHIEAVLTKAGVGGAEVACVGRDVPPSLSCWRIEESELAV